jgi:hypothetical protein
VSDSNPCLCTLSEICQTCWDNGSEDFMSDCICGELLHRSARIWKHPAWIHRKTKEVRCYPNTQNMNNDGWIATPRSDGRR